jgi:hypothetical protein
MPSHGVEIIDGIPVILRESVMYSFQPGSSGSQIPLGTYDSATKKAAWSSSDLTEWLSSYRESLASRSRK